MENYLLGLIGVLVAVIGYFLTSLHNRFEEHLRASAQADQEFAVVKTKMEEQCERLDRVEDKVDKLDEKISDVPFRVVELLKATK